MNKRLIFQLKVSLKNSPTPVWRRILLPVTATFAELHECIADCFNDDGTIYNFSLTKGPVRNWIQIKGAADEKDCGNFLVLDNNQDFLASELTLGQIFGKFNCKRLTHMYNFAHNIAHEVLFEKIIDAKGLLVLDNYTKLPMVIKSKGEMSDEIIEILYHHERDRETKSLDASSLSRAEFDLGELGKADSETMTMIAKSLFIGSYIMEDDENPSDTSIEKTRTLEKIVLKTMVKRGVIKPEWVKYSRQFKQYFWNIDQEDEIQNYIDRHDEGQF